jgi:hypothetical protein
MIDFSICVHSFRKLRAGAGLACGAASDLPASVAMRQGGSPLYSPSSKASKWSLVGTDMRHPDRCENARWSVTLPSANQGFISPSLKRRKDVRQMLNVGLRPFREPPAVFGKLRLSR